MKHHPVVLFDGVCTLCNATVDFLIRHDRSQQLRYASLQSDAGIKILADAGIYSEEITNIVLVQDQVCWQKSAAVLEISGYLNWPWCWLQWAVIIPAGLRDRVYDLIARNRYHWFGKKETCRIPTAEERSLFID